MGIECLQSGHIGALSVQPAGLPEQPFVTLTEVVCLAIWGAAESPGPTGSLRRLILER